MAFPELGIPAYTAEDLFHQDALISASNQAGTAGRVEHAGMLAKYVSVARTGLLDCRPERGELTFGILPAEVFS